MKTLYDGFTFEVVKESPILVNGMFTDKYNTDIQYNTTDNGKATGGRYRYIEDPIDDSKYRNIEDDTYTQSTTRFVGSKTVLYGNGRPVAVSTSSYTTPTTSRNSNTNGYFEPTSSTRYPNTTYTQNTISYLGTDILGSIRTVTSSYGNLESESTYDVFGKPITGTYTLGIDYGYLGKPYDTATGLYNYGYRDYSPTVASEFLRSKILDKKTISFRPFTTIDPIRDGNNWFVYVNNDPVNYVDLWGLDTSDITFPSNAFYINRPDPFSGGGIWSGAENAGLNTSARNIIASQDAAMINPDYQEGTGGPFHNPNVPSDTTWCNQAQFDVARQNSPGLATAMYGTDPNGYNTTATTATTNLANAAANPTSPITEVTPQQAQNLANQGYLVAAAGAGHLSSVRPGETYDEENGPTLSNIGPANFTGVETTANAFGQTTYGNGGVHFYYDTNQSVTQ